jgi:hypothetical protein
VDQDKLLNWGEVWKLFKYRENFMPSEKPTKPVTKQIVNHQVHSYEEKCKDMFNTYDRNKDALI